MNKVRKYIFYLIGLIAILLLPLTFQGYVKAGAFIDFIVYIDPGHGGKDNGTSYLSVYEDEINMAVGEKLYEICLKRNLMAYISRTSDYDLASQYASNRKQEDLKNRADAIEHSGCDVFISIHMNHYASPSVHGPMVYYEKSDDASYRLSLDVQKELNLLSDNNKSVHSDNFYLFRKCTPPGILVECGFLSNDEERGRLLDPKYQEAISEAIYQGIYQFYLGN